MAKESLKKMLEENIDLPGADDLARRQAVFLSLWDEILEAYKAGWCYKHIWQALQRNKVIDFSYTTFLSYIRKMKKRTLEVGRERIPGVKDIPTKGEAGKTSGSAPLPATTRVDLPIFGQGVKERDPKRF